MIRVAVEPMGFTRPSLGHAGGQEFRFLSKPTQESIANRSCKFDPMNVKAKIINYLFPIISSVFICLGASAQRPADPGVPIERLMKTPRNVHVGNYTSRIGVTNVDFTGTALTPKAHGNGKVEAAHGGLKIQLHVEGLGPAYELDPSELTYVLWAIPPSQSKAQNLGELVLKEGDSSVNSFTNLTAFALIVTAEPYFAVKQPSAMIVLQNAFHRSDDLNVVQADLLQLRSDPKTPLDIFEARNAVRIARLAGAERYAAEPFHKALQLLQQAEGIFAHKDHDLPDVKEKAREATEAAEDARAAATERGQESRPMPPADAQGAFANTQ